MNADEPVRDPAVLLEELDSIIREQELLRQRTAVLQARYDGLRPSPGVVLDSVSAWSAARRLSYVHETYMDAPLTFLRSARESASCIGEPRQCEQIARQVEGGASVSGPSSGGFRRSGDSARSRSGAPVPVSSEFARARTRELADRSRLRVDRGRSR